MNKWTLQVRHGNKDVVLLDVVAGPETAASPRVALGQIGVRPGVLAERGVGARSGCARRHGWLWHQASDLGGEVEVLPADVMVRLGRGVACFGYHDSSIQSRRSDRMP